MKYTPIRHRITMLERWVAEVDARSKDWFIWEDDIINAKNETTHLAFKVRELEQRIKALEKEQVVLDGRQYAFEK